MATTLLSKRFSRKYIDAQIFLLSSLGHTSRGIQQTQRDHRIGNNTRSLTFVGTLHAKKHESMADIGREGIRRYVYNYNL